MDESKHEIHSQVDAITAGTASVVNLTAGRLDATLCMWEGVGERVCTAWCVVCSMCDYLDCVASCGCVRL